MFVLSMENLVNFKEVSQFWKPHGEWSWELMLSHIISWSLCMVFGYPSAFSLGTIPLWSNKIIVYSKWRTVKFKVAGQPSVLACYIPLCSNRMVLHFKWRTQNFEGGELHLIIKSPVRLPLRMNNFRYSIIKQ